MSSWPLVRVDELCELRPQKSEARGRLKPTDLVSFVPMNDLPVDRKWFSASESRALCDVEGSYTYFADGDVLLAKITPCFENGKLGIARNLKNGAGFGSSEFFVLRPSARLLAEYLYYFLSRSDYRERGAKVMTGAVGHRRVPKEFIEGTQIPLPPLPEQRRIVAILDEAFEGIAKATANAERNLANARELFNRHLKLLFFHSINDQWARGTLDDICDAIGGAGFPKEYQGCLDEEFPFYKVSDMNILGNEREMKQHNNSISESVRKALGANVVPAGSTIFPKIGGAVSTNKKRITTLPCCVDNNVMAVSPKSGKGSGSFLYWVMRSIDLIEMANDAHLPSIKKSTVEAWPISFPRSIALQVKIADALDVLEDSVRSVEKINEARVVLLAELRSTILHKAFSGQLTGKEDVAA